MKIQEDGRETMKYHVLLVVAKIFFIAVVIINPDIKTTLFLVIGVLVEGWAEKKNYKIAQSMPQDLKDGIKYIFCGADPKNNILFLEEHIHEDEVITTDTKNTDDLSDGLHSTVFKVYDYDKPGIFDGAVFSQNLNIGEIVIRHEIEKDYVGIIRLSDYDPEAA